MMRSPAIIRFAAIAMLLCCMNGKSFAQSLDRPTTPKPQSAPTHQGFFDFALSKINPKGVDYGTSMESARYAVVENTIDDLYFWSNVVTLLLLSGLAAIVLFQWRAADKHEVIASSLIAQLFNGRVSDRIEIERRTQQFNQLVEAHNADVEKNLSQKASASQQNAGTAGSLTRGVRSLAEGKGISPAEAEKIEASALDGTAASLQQNNLLLQRRVEALQNSEQNLKQRLNQTTVLLDQERRRNGTLKGA